MKTPAKKPAGGKGKKTSSVAASTSSSKQSRSPMLAAAHSPSVANGPTSSGIKSESSDDVQKPAVGDNTVSGAVATKGMAQAHERLDLVYDNLTLLVDVVKKTFDDPLMDGALDHVLDGLRTALDVLQPDASNSKSCTLRAKVMHEKWEGSVEKLSSDFAASITGNAKPLLVLALENALAAIESALTGTGIEELLFSKDEDKEPVEGIYELFEVYMEVQSAAEALGEMIRAAKGNMSLNWQDEDCVMYGVVPF